MNSMSTQPTIEDLQHLQFCTPSEFPFMMMQSPFPFSMLPYDGFPYLMPKTSDIYPKSYEGEAIPYPAMASNQLLPKLQKDLERQPQPVKQAPVLKKPKQSHINTGHWTNDEHQVYMAFITQYENEMRSSIKKTSKIFKQMSELIGTRTPSQCRSHHQKFNPFQKKVKGQRSRAGRKKKLKIEEIPEPQEQVFLQNMYIPTAFIQMGQVLNNGETNHNNQQLDFFFQDFKVEEGQEPINHNIEMI